MMISYRFQPRLPQQAHTATPPTSAAASISSTRTSSGPNLPDPGRAVARCRANPHSTSAVPGACRPHRPKEHDLATLETSGYLDRLASRSRLATPDRIFRNPDASPRRRERRWGQWTRRVVGESSGSCWRRSRRRALGHISLGAQGDQSSGAQPEIKHASFVRARERERRRQPSAQLRSALPLEDAASQGCLSCPTTYATGHESLDNYISMISGQFRPNLITQADSPLPRRAARGGAAPPEHRRR